MKEVYGLDMADGQNVLQSWARANKWQRIGGEAEPINGRRRLCECCKAKVETDRRRVDGYFLLLLVTTTPATIAATITSKRMKRPKQIHRFLRAARADTTALSVCSTLRDRVGNRETATEMWRTP